MIADRPYLKRQPISILVLDDPGSTICLPGRSIVELVVIRVPMPIVMLTIMGSIIRAGMPIVVEAGMPAIACIRWARINWLSIIAFLNVALPIVARRITHDAAIAPTSRKVSRLGGATVFHIQRMRVPRIRL
jgi:hypothetical protein